MTLGAATLPLVLEIGAAGAPAQGETESGDRQLIRPLAGGVLLAVVDGLGHGRDAARAATVAIEALSASNGLDVVELLRECHEQLVLTRGGAVTLAWFAGDGSHLSWLGVGNVEGILVRAPTHTSPGARQSVMLRGGVVGYRLPKVASTAVPVAPGDVLILATDGVDPRFAENLPLTVSAQQLADEILRRHRRPADDSLVVVARYGGLAR